MSTERERADGASTATGGTPVSVDVTSTRRSKLGIAMVLAGPVIWTVHFLVVYLAVEAGCTGDGPGLDAFDPPVPTVVTIVATVGAALACVAAAVWTHRRWRADRTPETDRAYGEPHGGDPLAFVGLQLALLGVVAVLFVGVPALVLPACGP